MRALVSMETHPCCCPRQATGRSIARSPPYENLRASAPALLRNRYIQFLLSCTARSKSQVYFQSLFIRISIENRRCASTAGRRLVIGGHERGHIVGGHRLFCTILSVGTRKRAACMLLKISETSARNTYLLLRSVFFFVSCWHGV